MTQLLGKKSDEGKIRWDLLPFGALEEIARVYTFGCVKYESWNWYKGLTYSRCVAAMFRHFNAWWWKRESMDMETGCHHLASVGFYVLVLLTFVLEGRSETDDRHTLYLPISNKEIADADVPHHK